MSEGYRRDGVSGYCKAFVVAIQILVGSQH